MAEETEEVEVTLRCNVAHQSVAMIMSNCNNGTEVWLCVLLIIGAINDVLNRLNECNVTVPEVLDQLADYDEDIPAVAEAAAKMAREEIQVAH